MMYNISEFLTLCKEDIGIKDIPLPVDDGKLIERLSKSALMEFSQRAPRIVECLVNDSNRVADPVLGDHYARYIYQFPKHIYQDSTILEIVDFDIAKPTGFSDYYMPQTMVGSPITVLESIADIQIAAAMAATTSRAPSWKFVPPDKMYVYNGWTGGDYVVTLSMTHDISLSTIPPTAMSSFRELATLDLKAYLYNQLSRKDNLDVGIGNINLKIDRWESAESDMRELLRSWDETSSLSVDSINYY